MRGLHCSTHTRCWSEKFFSWQCGECHTEMRRRFEVGNITRREEQVTYDACFACVNRHRRAQGKPEFDTFAKFIRYNYTQYQQLLTDTASY